MVDFSGEGFWEGRADCGSIRPGTRTSRSAFKGEEPGEDDPLLGFAPYVHKAPRGNSITPERQRGFIAALAASGIVTQAARRVGVSLEALYRLRHRAGAEGFARAWEEALDRGMARLEDCALERAIVGEERLVVRGGEVVGRWVRYDTPLLMFLLRNRRRGRFEGYGAGAGGARLSPEQERMRAMEEEAEAEAILQSIDAKLDRMRERWLEGQAREAEEREAEAGEDVAGEDVAGGGEAPCPVAAGEVAAGEVAAGGVAEAEVEPRLPGGLRMVPNLLQEGDRALGLPRLNPKWAYCASVAQDVLVSAVQWPAEGEIEVGHLKRDLAARQAEREAERLRAREEPG